MHKWQCLPVVVAGCVVVGASVVVTTLVAVKNRTKITKIVLLGPSKVI